MAVDYLEVIRDSRGELKQLLVQRDVIDKRITQVILALKGLSRFMPENERGNLLQELRNARRKTLSLTDSISAILQSSSEGLKAAEVRDRLEESGFDLDEYSQPLGTIMTTLQRLVDARKVTRKLVKGAGVSYKWVTTWGTLTGLPHVPDDGEKK